MKPELVTPAYPAREQYFSHKFTRLLFRSCVGALIGPDATLLLIAIVHCEDAKRYSGPVAFFNENLADQIGLSLSSMKRARDRAVEAGWLNYTPGTKRRAAMYFVTIPRCEEGKPDGPTDEDSGSIVVQPDPLMTQQWASNDPVMTQQAGHLLPFPFPSKDSSEPAEPASEPEPAVVPILTFPTVGRGAKNWHLVASMLDGWREAYPGIDPLAEARKALVWINANPTKRKTPSGMPRFLVSWLTRAQNDAGKRNGSPAFRRNESNPHPGYDQPASPVIAPPMVLAGKAGVA